jgi:hypothetical protein
MTMLSEQMEAARVSAGDPTDGLLERLAEMVGAKARVNTVFGDPIRQGDLTVVPVAKVRWGFGGGGGRSEATATAIISRPSSVVPIEKTLTRGLLFSSIRM